MQSRLTFTSPRQYGPVSSACGGLYSCATICVSSYRAKRKQSNRLNLVCAGWKQLWRFYRYRSRRNNWSKLISFGTDKDGLKLTIGSWISTRHLTTSGDHISEVDCHTIAKINEKVKKYLPHICNIQQLELRVARVWVIGIMIKGAANMELRFAVVVRKTGSVLPIVTEFLLGCVKKVSPYDKYYALMLCIWQCVQKLTEDYNGRAWFQDGKVIALRDEHRTPKMDRSVCRFYIRRIYLPLIVTSQTTLNQSAICENEEAISFVPTCMFRKLSCLQPRLDEGHFLTLIFLIQQWAWSGLSKSSFVSRYRWNDHLWRLQCNLSAV